MITTSFEKKNQKNLIFSKFFSNKSYFCSVKLNSMTKNVSYEVLHRGGGRYEKMVVLLFTDPNRNVGGAKGCLLSKIKKVGGAIAPPAPPVPPPLLNLEIITNNRPDQNLQHPL